MIKQTGTRLVSGADLGSNSHQQRETSHANPNTSQRRVSQSAIALSKPTADFLRRLSGITFFVNAVNPVQAFDSTTCCLKRARELFATTGTKPWAMCAAGVVITNPFTEIYPTVTAD